MTADDPYYDGDWDDNLTEEEEEAILYRATRYFKDE
jgi:hypothetical protein